MTSSDSASQVHLLYKNQSIFTRILSWGRPYICPFDPLLEWVFDGSSVFDIGCGSGLWLMTLSMNGKLGIGVGCDPNQKALASARMAEDQLDEKHIPQELTFFATDNSDEWPTGPFDLVSLIDVIHHVPKEQQIHFLIEAFHRVKVGGRLIYKDMASKPLFFATANAAHDLILAKQIIHYLPFEDAEAALVEVGARVLHKSGWRRLWYKHELLVVER